MSIYLSSISHDVFNPTGALYIPVFIFDAMPGNSKRFQ